MKTDNPIVTTVQSILALFFLPLWYLEKLLPRDNTIWLFGSWFGEKYSDNSKAMYEYTLEHEPNIKPIWISHSIEIVNQLKKENKPAALSSSFEGIRYCLKAGCVFITTSADETNAKFLNGAFMVWLWHGVGLKYIGADEFRYKWTNYSPWKKIKVRFNRFLFPYRDKAHISCVANTSDFFTRFFCSAFEVKPEQIWVDGYPRNDVLFKGDHELLVERYRSKFPSAQFIIYMPTHRINALKGVPFNGFEGFGFDSTAFYETLEDNDYVFFYKGHFYDQAGNNALKNERFINVTDNDYDDLYSFISNMDILITDFSSIYFDFLLLRKPVILAPFGFDDYVAHERGLQFDYNEQDAIKAYNWDELISILNNRGYYVPSESNLHKFHKYIDGNSCSRIAERAKRELSLTHQTVS